jgi:hypothetical protein
VRLRGIRSERRSVFNFSKNNSKPARQVARLGKRPIPKVLRFTPHSKETFRIRRLAGRDSATTYGFSARGGCAEKRTSFRYLSRRHLSVDFRGIHKTIENAGRRWCRRLDRGRRASQSQAAPIRTLPGQPRIKCGSWSRPARRGRSEFDFILLVRELIFAIGVGASGQAVAARDRFDSSRRCRYQLSFRPSSPLCRGVYDLFHAQHDIRVARLWGGGWRAAPARL